MKPYKAIALIGLTMIFTSYIFGLFGIVQDLQLGIWKTGVLFVLLGLCAKVFKWKYWPF